MLPWFVCSLTCVGMCMCVCNIWIIRIKSTVFSVGRGRKRAKVQKTFFFHCSIEVCTQFDAFNCLFLFFVRKFSECACVCVFRIQFIVYLQMKWPTLSGDECRQTHTHVCVYKTHVHVWMPKCATQWYVNVFIIMWLYRILSEIHRNDIENIIIVYMCCSLYLTRSHVSFVSTCSLLFFLISFFKFIFCCCCCINRQIAVELAI